MSSFRDAGSVLCSVSVGCAWGVHAWSSVALGEGRAASAVICDIALVAWMLACRGGLLVLCPTAGEGYWVPLLGVEGVVLL